MQLRNAVAALIGLCALQVPAAPNQPLFLRKLLSQRANHWANGTVISFPNSTTFDDATQRWSTFDAPTYLAAVSPANERDVAKSVHD